MEMERPTDAELMVRVKAGDERAFEAVIRRYKDAMVNYLTRLTGCRDRAKDLAQETFLRLYLTRDRYQESGRLGGYLYRLATNLVRSEERKARRQRLLSFGLWGGDMVRQGDGDTPHGELEQQEEMGMVQEAIRKLPLRFRVPLVLHEIEGLSYPEIAGLLDAKENTIKTRIFRGRRLLQGRLDAYYNGIKGEVHEGHPREA